MIKANELRVGNYILNEKNKTFKITWINDNIEKISDPIILTKEILLNCQFKQKNGYGYIHNGLEGNIFWSVGYTFFVFQYYGFRVELHYLHQLQNLYFALTGSELVFSTEP